MSPVLEGKFGVKINGMSEEWKLKLTYKQKQKENPNSYFRQLINFVPVPFQAKLNHSTLNS